MNVLSLRLQQLLQWIPPHRILIDVGCDHGWLPIFARKQGWIDQAIAVDRAKAPLALAEKNAQDIVNISFVLSDGLDDVDLPHHTVVSIAGMGGLQMLSIIKRAPLERIDKLLLQPNRDGHLVRNWLKNNGWGTQKASVVQENNRYFLGWCAQKMNQTGNDREDQWHWQEPWFLQNSSKLWKEWLRSLLIQLQKKCAQNNDPAPLCQERDAIIDILRV